MPRRRRQRYTAFYFDSDPKVIMAYHIVGARMVAQSCWGEPMSIRKGDFRMKARPDSGWQIDKAALNRATKLLNLKWPVHVVKNGREGSTRGNYLFQLGSRARKNASVEVRHSWLYHRIMLKSYLTPEEANESLWHELIHAAQAENAGTMEAWLGWQNRQHRNWNYNDRPMEIEAREGAKKFSGMALTKAL